MTALTWSTEPPDRPGWWWMREEGKRPEVVCIVIASWLNGRLFAITAGSAPPVDTINAQFAGPIAEPRDPGE